MIHRFSIVLLMLAVVLGSRGTSQAAETEGCDLVTGSGNVTTETRSARNFSKVVLAGQGEVIIKQTGTESLEVTADDNLIPILTSNVSNKSLSLNVDSRKCIVSATKIRFTVTVKDLKSVKLAGAGHINLQQIDTNTLTAQITGAGSVTAAGKTDQLNVSITGSGSYDGPNLTSNSSVLDISGFGSITAAVRNTLNATISGIGSISYIGDPNVTKKITGIGSVSKQE
ncbi:MAG: hypothetical protein GFH27_549325n109 [Chloroflexi bacterium AL-W]|nr:hypothetical protein [Chloroflexi bacterium AL-W]